MQHATHPITYVPVLSALGGEFDAVLTVDGAATGVCPLFEITPPRKPRRRHPDDPEPAAPPLKAYLADRVEKLINTWGYKSSLYLDAPDFDQQVRVGKVNYYSYLLEQTEAMGLAVIPVTSPSRPQAQQWPATKNGSVCLRITSHELHTGCKGMTAFLKRHRLEPEACDFVVDAGELFQETEQATARLLTLLKLVPLPNRWRNLITLGGSFPDVSKAVPNGTLRHIVRADYLAWLRIARIGVTRMPTFGDYGIHSPGPPGTGFRGAHTIRYAGPTSWAIARGMPPDHESHPGDFIELARAIRDTAEWNAYSEDHCQGCARLAAAKGGSSPGNPQQWVTAGLVHHLAVVRGDLANVSGAA